MTTTPGFEELPHTADWALRAWAPDLATLFVIAAKGMNALAGAELTEGLRLQRTIETCAPDAESLLVAFLGELAYLAEQENLGFDDFRILLEKDADSTYRLRANLSGARLKALTKVIKAVTYHNLNIHSGACGLEVEIVFDV